MKLVVFDWSGVISDYRRPVYEANMAILRDYGRPMVSFAAWLAITTMTAVEFLRQHKIKGTVKELAVLYRRHRF